jgi:chromate transporter
VNTATFIGYKYKGIPGGILATLGVVFPSLIIISVIAAFLRNFADIPVVAHALAGVNACVVALIASSVLKLGKTTVKDLAGWCIFLVVLVLTLLFGLSPALLILCAGVAGYTIRRLTGLSKGGDGA